MASKIMQLLPSVDGDLSHSAYNGGLQEVKHYQIVHLSMVPAAQDASFQVGNIQADCGCRMNLKLHWFKLKQSLLLVAQGSQQSAGACRPAVLLTARTESSWC